VGIYETHMKKKAAVLHFFGLKISQNAYLGKYITSVQNDLLAFYQNGNLVIMFLVKLIMLS